MSILGMVLVPSPMSQSEDISRSILSGVTYGSAMVWSIQCAFFCERHKLMS